MKITNLMLFCFFGCLCPSIGLSQSSSTNTVKSSFTNTVETTKDHIVFRCLFNKKYDKELPVKIGTYLQNDRDASLFVVHTRMFYDVEVTLKSPTGNIFEYKRDDNNNGEMITFSVREIKQGEENKSELDLSQLHKFMETGLWSCKITRTVYFTSPGSRYPAKYLLLTSPEFSFEIVD